MPGVRRVHNWTRGVRKVIYKQCPLVSFALSNDLFQLHRRTNFYLTNHVVLATLTMASDPFLDFCDQLKEMSSASTDEWSFFSPAPVEPAQVNEPQNPEYSPAVPNLDIISGITEDLRFPKSQGAPSAGSGCSEMNPIEMLLESPAGNYPSQTPAAQEPVSVMSYAWPTHQAAAPYYGIPYIEQPRYLEQAVTPATLMHWYTMGYNTGVALHGPHVAPYGVTSAPMTGLPYVGQTTDYNDYINGGLGSTTAHAANTPRPRKKVRTRFRQSHVVRKPRTWTPVALNYQCSHCHAWFSRSGVRDRHMTTGCTKGKQQECQCPICLKMYSRTDSRGRHCHSQHGMSYQDAVEWAEERLSDRDASVDEGSPAQPNDY
ncbi:hypothetical protein POSPLADRAFT_1139007 [Postia placenta MAD-698-R-SB12]|uniref:Uncharacterized protein n=1 Tax=Postia placenta MAD-698-R-SB12 TaxID=670580 RepID=A0A1X6N3Y5_9APHY|nr:hypothetical protein POSPLADRAFT_1139007 [Postia placenta MAD-698-R-SB12]OSX63315.1 hypothetical protein POSPLADRAFT_1139007 [Postia placenta MAD-698-R-SB12]